MRNLKAVCARCGAAIERKQRRTIPLAPQDRLEAIGTIQASMERGIPAYATCRKLGVSLATVTRWQRAYASHGLDGLVDGRKGRSGRPRKNRAS